MNLLDKARWTHAFPWGTIINPDTANEICIGEKLATWMPDGTLHLGCAKGPANGWKTGKNSDIVNVRTDWSVGALISREECRTHYGTYSFRFRLPGFRGSWPAIWLIDLHPAPPKGDGMGMPPEIDILEHFRKDAFLSRFHSSHAFHQGPSYANNTVVSDTFWRLLPIDLKDIELVFTWMPTGMNWVINGRKILSVAPDTPNYPTRPMNLIINAGLGLDWKPRVEKFEDFVVYKAEFLP